MAVIVLALEAFSASTLSRALRLSGAGPLSLADPEIVVYEAFAAYVGRLGEAQILVTHRNLLHLARYLEEHPGGLRLVYVRPGIVLVKDLFGAISGSYDPALQFRMKLLDYLDSVFGTAPTISLEELYHRPVMAAVALSNLLGASIDPQWLTGPDAGEYHWSLQRMLQSFGPARSARHGVPGFALGVAYPITGAGRLALNSGWSYPEADFIWSDGPSASLLLPVPAAPGEALRCRLAGFVVAGPFRVTTSIGTSTLDDRSFDISEPRDLLIDVPIPPPLAAAGGLFRLDLRFENTICPRELGLNENSRRVGCGLRSITLYSDGREAGTSGEAAERARPDDLVAELAASLGEDRCRRLRGSAVDTAGVGEGAGRAPALIPALKRLAAGGHGCTILAIVGDCADAIPAITRLCVELGTFGDLLICCSDSAIATVSQDFGPAETASAAQDIAAAVPADALRIVLLAETPRRLLEHLADRDRSVALTLAWLPEHLDAATAALREVAQGRYAKTVNLLLMTQASGLSCDAKQFIEEHGAIVELAGASLLATARSG